MDRKKCFSLLLTLLLVVPCGACSAAPQQPLYVLMYHDVVADGMLTGPWTVTVSQFRTDLAYLVENGYTTVLPSELASGGPLPDKPVLITFDDGYVSNYLLVLPLLVEFQVKAAVAPIVRYVDEGRTGYLTWDMCREMAASGLVEFGSHTYDLHDSDEGIARLKRESRADYEARVFPDLDRSIARIEAELGAPVLYFAHPHGSTEKWALEFLSQRFDVITTSRAAVADLADGLLDLPRFNIGENDAASQFLPAAESGPAR